MRIPIRTKVAAALAVPLVALVAGAAFEVVQARDDAHSAAANAAAVAEETELATAAVGPGSLISNLQLERNITGVEQLGLQGRLELPVATSAEARAATDASAEDLRTFVEARGGRVATAFDGALGAIDDLEGVRARVDASTAVPGLTNAVFANDVFLAYSGIIDALLNSSANIALGVDDAELRNGVELVALATRGYELRSTIVSRIILQVLENDTSVAARTTVASLLARSDQVDADLLVRSAGRYQDLAQAVVLSERVQGENGQFTAYVNDGTADLAALVALVSSSGDNGYVLLRQRAADALNATAAKLQANAETARADAEDHQRIVLALAAAALLLAVVVSAVASRSITQPLRSLMGQARTMAEDRLPAAVQQVHDTPLGDDVVVPELPPVRVRTRDEVADVAAALTTVQGAALDLAVEQAVLRRNIADSFVNMSRRNQNLLDRQLSSITDLEREEADPERLEGLFRLDHLATRMRRNAESLLRLAGGSSGETVGWAGPVSIGDIIRGALGEVEEYQRVDVKALDPVTANGTVAADVAHAVAELIENALAFSPPEERVEVRGRRTDGGGYVLAVIDNGMGMSDERLAVANRRLAGQESFTVAPSRYLGHYVAGHLATTHGIGIQLQATPAGGITARIDLPASVLAGDVSPAARVPAAAEAPQERATARDDLASWLVPAPDDASSLVDHARPAPVATTANGLVKRVRGGGEQVQAPFTSPPSSAFAPSTSEPVAGPSSAADVGSFLSDFARGVERGLADSGGAGPDDSPATDDRRPS